MKDNCFEVLDGGFLTTIQDIGRFGYRSRGVSKSGASDIYSFKIYQNFIKWGLELLVNVNLAPRYCFNKGTLLISVNKAASNIDYCYFFSSKLVVPSSPSLLTLK